MKTFKQLLKEALFGLLVSENDKIKQFKFSIPAKMFLVTAVNNHGAVPGLPKATVENIDSFLAKFVRSAWIKFKKASLSDRYDSNVSFLEIEKKFNKWALDLGCRNW